MVPRRGFAVGLNGAYMPVVGGGGDECGQFRQRRKSELGE